MPLLDSRLAQQLLNYYLPSNERQTGQFEKAANEGIRSRLQLGERRVHILMRSLAVQSALALGEGVQRAGRLFLSRKKEASISLPLSVTLET